jgi:hypothetical protein
MATLTKQGQVQYQGGEMLPAVGTDAYNQSLSGIIPNVPAKMSASDLGNGSTAYTPPVNNKSAQTGLSVANTALAENITSSQEQAQAEQTAPKNDRSGILASIKAGIDQLRGKGDRTAELNQEEGTFQKKQQATKLEGDYISKQRAYDKQIEKIRENKGGMLESAVEAEVANVERQKNSELADISIQYKIANGAYTDAVEIVNAKVAAEFEPIQNEIDSLSNLYQLYADDLTESEKIQVQANIQEKQSALDYQRQLARDKTLHQYQLSEIAYRNSFEDKPTPSSASVSSTVNQIDSVNGLLANTAGLAAAVGTTGIFGRGGLVRGAVGKKQEFTAGIQQLTSQLTLDNLIAAKGRGATFGALSEGELNILAGGATKLNTWAKKDKDGNIIGFKTTEANVRRELDTINNFAKKDYIIKGGKPEDVGAVTMPNGAIVVKNSDGTITQLN